MGELDDSAFSHGFNDQPPEFMPARDITAKDLLTGRKVRETPDGPINVNTDRVEWLFAHNKITQRQHRAANILQQDWKIAQIAPCSSGSMIKGASGGLPDHPNDRKVSAMKRHGAAHIALGRLRNAVTLVVEENKTFQQVAAILAIHERAAAERCLIGLDLLADFYRLPEIA